MLTLQKLQTMHQDTEIANGVTSNDPDGVFMTNNDLGRKLIWVAKRGGAPAAYPDWAIYIHWESNGIDFVRKHGDKVTDKNNIQKLVPCDEQALKCYRR